MAEERALVTEVLSTVPSMIRVKTQRQSTCSACELKNSCGQHLIAKIASGKGMELEVPNTLNARVGDVVVLSIPESGLLKASMIMFLVPLLCLVVPAAVVSSMFNASEIWVALSALAGLFLGFVVARKLAKGMEGDEAFQPRLSALALSSSETMSCHSPS